MVAGVHPLVPVDKNKKMNVKDTWKVSQSMMSNPDKFKEFLEGMKDKIDKQEVHAYGFKAL